MQATGDPATWRKRTDRQVGAAPQLLSPEEKDILAATAIHYPPHADIRYKFVSDVLDLLRNWPQFFSTRELSGENLHAALLSVASHLLLLSALLAGVSITPLSSPPQNVSGLRTKVHGALWSLLLMFNFATLGASALFMFHLLGCPPQLGWVWMCNIGPLLITLPFLLMSCSAVLSFVALSFTTWFIYGRVVGILAAAFAATFVTIGFALGAVIGTRHIETLNTGGVGPPQNTGTAPVNNAGAAPSFPGVLSTPAPLSVSTVP